MQARNLPAATGAQWVRGGWRLFRKQPFGFTALLFFYWLSLLAASALVGWIAQALGTALPFVSADALQMGGGILVAVLTPVLTVGFLQACRAADHGLPAHPILLFAPFRAGRETLSRLLGLGALQMLALIAILLVTTGTGAFQADVPVVPAVTGPSAPAPSAPAPSATTPAAPPTAMSQADEEAVVREAVVHLEQGLAYLPVAMLMWYAPMLVAWHRLPVGKALFFSLVALWRNRGAFVVFGFTWLAVWFGLSIAMTLVAVVLNLANVAAIVMAPVVMVLLTWMYCSIYATYDTVFVDETPVTPQPVVD